jgi:RHS repeat-associated protein
MCSGAHFTGKERDSESGLDNFGARYDSSQYGRFMTPDPGNVGSDPRDPQSWNAYSYVGNNPLGRIDADGLDYDVCVDDGNGGQKCTYVANDKSFQNALQNPGAGISVSGDNNRGTIYGTDGNGNQVQVGSYQHFAGPGEEGAQEEPGFLFGIISLFRPGLGGASAGTAASSVWDLGWSARGGAIEQTLGANLPRTFPVIDAFENGVANSIKSVDLTAVTYQAPDALASKLERFRFKC